jgi:hypothetical protein
LCAAHGGLSVQAATPSKSDAARDRRIDVPLRYLTGIHGGPAAAAALTLS